MAGGPDLFVICKTCSAEVSPYITECPYCGSRLRKRAPKIDRDREGAKPRRPRGARRIARPALPKLRAGEIPGIRGDETARPNVTIGLVVLSLFGYLSLAFLARGDLAVRALSGDPWRFVTAPFVYANGWYQFAALVAIGLYGWRLELRRGPLFVLGLFALCAVGGIAVAAAVDPNPFVLGGNGAALGLLATWAIPVLFARRRGEYDEADMLGTLVIFLTVALMPLATTTASAVAGATGLAVGVLAGLALSRPQPG
jgi:membrane associated rhomboid family serine protease